MYNDIDARFVVRDVVGFITAQLRPPHALDIWRKHFKNSIVLTIYFPMKSIFPKIKVKLCL